MGSDSVSNSRHGEASVLEEEREGRKRAEEKIVELTEENRKLKETIRELNEKLKRYEAKTNEDHDEIQKEVIKTKRNPSDGMYSPKKENTSTMEDLDEPCCSKDLGPQPRQQPTRVCT